MFIVQTPCPHHTRISRQLTAADKARLASAASATMWEAAALRRDVLLEALEIKHTVLGRRLPLLSHSTAAHVHGLLFALETPPVLEVTHHRQGHRHKNLSAHPSYVPDDHVIVVNGRMLTSVEWTVADIAADRGLALALPMADDALRRGLTSHESLAQVSARWPRARHSASVRSLVELAAASAESAGESLTKLRLHELGQWKRYRPQFEAHDAEGLIGRLDFADLDRLLAIEFDGWHKYTEYGNTVTDSFKREKRRDARLLKAGWTIRRVEWADVLDVHRFARAIS